MILGNKTINYRVYSRENGKVDSVADNTNYKRPSIEHLTDTIKGAGIMGEIDMPTIAQLGSMEGELTFRRSNEQVFGLSTPKLHEIEVRWVVDAVDSATGSVTSISCKDIVKYRVKSHDLGTIETNTSNENKISFEILYYHHIENGKSMLEIDKLNFVYKVLGIDYAANIRESL